MKKIFTVFLGKMFSRGKVKTSSFDSSSEKPVSTSKATHTYKLRQFKLNVIDDAPSQRKNIPGLNGWLDKVSGDIANGWAYNPIQEVVEVEVLADGVPIGYVSASEYRVDLEAAGFGKGKHGYHFKLPIEHKNKNITCRIVGTNFELYKRKLK